MSLPPRPPLLAGREGLLADIHAKLTQGPAPWPRTVVLTGLGGVGKTSAAGEYAHRHLAEVGVAWQLPAEEPSVLAAAFTELAAQLGVRDLADTRNPVASVHAALAAYPAQWLLVFDNVPDAEAVRPFLPPGGPGRMLITSQSATWPVSQVLDVQVLDRDVAADLLVNRSGDTDRDAARELATELGGLPLALEQAAAYVQTTGIGLARYLGLFRQRHADLLSRGEPTGYRGTVAATLALACTRLEQRSPSAAGLLRLLACLAPEPVPVDLLLSASAPFSGLPSDAADLLSPLAGDEIALADAVAELRRYSLVALAGTGSVLVHRLVQAVVLDQLTDEHVDLWRRATAALVAAAIPRTQNVVANWPAYAALLPHAQMALAENSNAMMWIASNLGESGSYQAALELWDRIASAYEQALGAEHPDTLTTRDHLARWTGEAGDPAAARDQYAALLPIHERVLGPEHPNTLVARDNLARWTGEAGDPAAARDQSAALLPIHERILGPEHPDTLAARSNLAHWTGQAGDPAAARDQSAALLPIRERILGPEHPDTLAARDNLARWTGEAGDPAAARDQSAALLPIRERILGPEHPDTLTARNNLAHWTGQAGDPAAARDQSAALLPIRERILGPEHPNTLTTRNNLAYWTKQAQAEDPPPSQS